MLNHTKQVLYLSIEVFGTLSADRSEKKMMYMLFQKGKQNLVSEL